MLARFVPSWQGVAAVGLRPHGGGIDRLCEVIGQLQGLAIPASVIEGDVLASRVGDYQPRMLDELLAAGEILWVGAGSLGRDDGRVVLATGDQARSSCLGPGLGPAWKPPVSPAGHGPGMVRARRLFRARQGVRRLGLGATRRRPCGTICGRC